MKHIAILSLLTLNSSLLTLSAAVPLRWTVETSRAVPAQFEAYQGETLAIEAALQSDGKPLEAPSNYSLYWQTNGMGNAYWEVKVKGEGEQRNDSSAVHLDPSPSPTNVLFATWSPTNDVGAKVYNCFIGKPGTIYHAAFQLRLRPSPGALPNELPLPQKVIDFAKVRVLNPPWSGGGGRVDTNAVRDIVREQLATNGIRAVDGAARTLPKYLHERNFDSSYPDEAQEYYRSRGDGKASGGCSAVRDGNFLYRNFDYPFDERAEFVVRVSSRGGDIPVAERRFASIGISQVGTNLTEQIVTSGKWSKWYKALPGATVDGINENGVVCEINVVDGDPQTSGWHTNATSEAIHPLAAVRWILDHATNSQHAATYIAANIRFPAGWTQNFHYMVADERKTWIVENGIAYIGDQYVLTNFPLYGPTSEGSGKERYILLFNGASITNTWYTRAYHRETVPPWVSDLSDVLAYTNAIFDAWAAHPKEYFRNKTNNGIPWWQTVHTSVYDITNRTLRVAVQETDDWYTFAVDQANVDAYSKAETDAKLSPIEAQLAALQSGKRDILDEKAYKTNFSRFTWTSDDPDCPEGWLDLANAPDAPQPMYNAYLDGWDGPGTKIGGFEWGSTATGGKDATSIEFDWIDFGSEPIRQFHAVATRTKSVDEDTAHKFAKRVANPTAGAIAKFDADGNLVEDTDTENEIAKKADEFTAWEFSGDDYDPASKYRVEEMFYPSTPPGDDWYDYNLYKDGVLVGYTGDYSRTKSVSVDFRVGGDLTVNIIATRRRVLYTGDAATPQDLTDAISTNNPAFVSAVRSISPTPSANIRVFDAIRQCWWIGTMVNGFINWEVE